MLRFCSLSQKRYHRNIFTMVLYSEKRRKMITTIKMAGYINHPRPTLWRQTPREFIRTVTLGPIPPKVDQHSILLTLTFPHRLSVDEHMLQVLEQSLLVDLAKVGTLSGYLRGGASAAGRGRLPYIQRKTSARRLLPDVSVCGRLPPAACLANVNWSWLLLLLADLPTHPLRHLKLAQKSLSGKRLLENWCPKLEWYRDGGGDGLEWHWVLLPEWCPTHTIGGKLSERKRYLHNTAVNVKSKQVLPKSWHGAGGKIL